LRVPAQKHHSLWPWFALLTRRDSSPSSPDCRRAAAGGF
jgi:hypothetical protein